VISCTVPTRMAECQSLPLPLREEVGGGGHPHFPNDNPEQ
jgi:hypothetical protein